MVVLSCADNAGSASLLSSFRRGRSTLVVGRIRDRRAGWRGRWRSTTVQCLSNVGPRPGLEEKSETRLCVFVAERVD
jgi:hypothetical protein